MGHELTYLLLPVAQPGTGFSSPDLRRCIRSEALQREYVGPITDYIPRMEVELTPGSDTCADCGGRLRRIGEDVTEELTAVHARSPRTQTA